MKSANFRTFCDSMEDVAHDIVRACRRAARTIAVMPWPAMLACCIGLALVISILPLAFFLFVVFMAVKVVVGAFVIDARSRSQSSRPHTYKHYEQ
jgi:membrane protein implicated in regulation of membrane protease activity